MKGSIIKGSKKRSFSEIREAILESLDRPKTITQISREIESSWITTRRHLRWFMLLGKVRVEERLGRRFYFKVLE
jgi:response regulator of citrate/malate metabolism